MASEEKFFNVINNSVRLIHIGGNQIIPNQVVKLIDDPKGINRADVGECEFLEITDEEADPVESEEVQTVKPKQTSNKQNTPTGAGWVKK